MSRVLIIDDDPSMVQVISDICAQGGHMPIALNSGAKAIGMLAGHAPQLVLTDVRMDGVGGMEVLRACQSEIPGTPVIMITANKQLQMGVEAMKAGAFDYITKPFKIDELQIAIQRALDRHHEQREIRSLRQMVRDRYSFENIVGTAPRMQEIFNLVAKVANTDSTILILGESGTGKELVAKALHFNSDRHSQPFVAINCSALPENLLESELFGHKKGAFTGAVQDKMGLFEEAEGGTIFLDEISSMAPLLQTKLLRVLQERLVRRVGDNKSIPIHVRVLAATNEPLYEKAKSGAFREDLYYRLAVIPVEMPPLRERLDDIPLLVQHFLLRHSGQTRRDEPFVLGEHVLSVLRNYRWPGNVRELENAIERACALCEEGVIQVKDLPPHLLSQAVESKDAPRKFPVGYTLSEFSAVQEKQYIQDTIDFNGGSRDLAARMLKVSAATLYRKMGIKVHKRRNVKSEPKKAKKHTKVRAKPRTLAS